MTRRRTAGGTSCRARLARAPTWAADLCSPASTTRTASRSRHPGASLVPASFAWMRVAERLRSLIDSTEVLRVAPRHLDDVGPNLDKLAAPLLPTAAAPLAEAERDLVIGSSWLGRTSQRLTRRAGAEPRRHRPASPCLDEASPSLLERWRTSPLKPQSGARGASCVESYSSSGRSPAGVPRRAPRFAAPCVLAPRPAKRPRSRAKAIE